MRNWQAIPKDMVHRRGQPLAEEEGCITGREARSPWGWVVLKVGATNLMNDANEPRRALSFLPVSRCAEAHAASTPT